ncbi:MAG: hypothetical protein NDJ89_08280 [Oligoflexia bacterium]|nr:hypothetical protein [Oligoflexia bacterium]
MPRPWMESASKKRVPPRPTVAKARKPEQKASLASFFLGVLLSSIVWIVMSAQPQRELEDASGKKSVPAVAAAAPVTPGTLKKTKVAPVRKKVLAIRNRHR